MDGRGGCCIDRYAAHDMSKVDQIMLRFRPIAPKPAAGGAISSGSVPENNVKTGRQKRRYVKDGNKNVNSNNKRRKSSPSKSNSGGSSSGRETVVTLALLPEAPERKDYSARVSGKAPIWLSSDRKEGVGLGKSKKEWVGTWMTVESVTDTWVDGRALGDRDEERVMNLERDTCPGFVSDGLERVVWTNKAYREMVGEEEIMMVGLMTKESVLLPVMSEAAFTCRVRVTCGNERGWSKTVPCDVWRMDSGGYAWRLDIKAALSLGR